MKFDERGRHVEFHDLPDDPEHVLMVETFDLTHPKCPLVISPWVSEAVKKFFADAVSIRNSVSIPKFAIGK